MEKHTEYKDLCNYMINDMRNCSYSIDKFLNFQNECKGTEFKKIISKINEKELNDMEEKFQRYVKKIKKQMGRF